MAGGRIDGAFFVGGLIIGSALFSEVFTLIEPLYKSGAMGRVFLNDFFGLPLGMTLLAVTVAGILFIVFFAYLEKTVGKKISGRTN